MTACARKRAVLCLCLIITASSPFAAFGGEAVFNTDRPFPSLYPGRLFRDAIEAASATPSAAGGRVTGLIVPHHLLAADLVAKGFALVREGEYDRIVILTPDHYRRGRTLFSVPGRDFMTPLGDVPLDREGAEQLKQSALVSESNLFSHEHGVQVLLPFVARHFLGVPVLPVAIGIRSGREEWRAMAYALASISGGRALIIQSTDFSHYLGREETALHDDESQAVIMSRDPELALALRQPSHIDSRGALYIQMTLQRELGASPMIAARSSSFDYDAEEAKKSGGTSYFVVVYRMRE
ncbi:MAG: AmmeMemoRadiSam system protein B [Aminobacteriaceae bacterium]